MAASRQTTAPSPAEAADPLIGGRFRLLPASRPVAFGGYDSVAVQDLRTGAQDIVALRAEPGTPPRAQLAAFKQARHEALSKVLAHGPVGASFWVVAAAPPGPSLASLSAPWSGNALLTQVLRPAALALEELQMNGLTHRAIRPDNVFVASGGRGVVLGPCWMGPPASRQPAMFEPPYSAICAPAARGDGTIMDDVYALGVLLLSLHTRAVPLGGLSTRDIVQLKLEHGSFAALVGQARLAHNFEEILRAMLADDPSARPQPQALAKLDAIHAGRGGQRRTRAFGRPIALGERTASNRRVLALLCAEQPAEAMALLRQGTLAHWLNRGPEDASLIGNLEKLRQEDSPVPGTTSAAAAGLGDDLALTCLIALLDPLAPLFWRGHWLWPEALGPILAASLAQPPLLGPQEAAALLDDTLNRRVVARWRQLRNGRSDQSLAKLPPRLLRGPDEALLVSRVAYALNPFLACASPRFAGEQVMEPAALLSALERLAALEKPGAPLLDVHCLAFLDTRMEDADAKSGPAPGGPAAGLEARRELSALERCQRQTGCGPLPGIAASLLPRLEVLLEGWPGVSRKQRRLASLHKAAAAGDLAAMLLLLSDVRQRQEDEAAREHAFDEAARIQAAIEEQARTTPQSLRRSLDVARDTASAAGMLCVMAALFLELLKQ